MDEPFSSLAPWSPLSEFHLNKTSASSTVPSLHPSLTIPHLLGVEVIRQDVPIIFTLPFRPPHPKIPPPPPAAAPPRLEATHPEERGLLSNAAAAETKARVGRRGWCCRREEEVAEAEATRASMVVLMRRRKAPRGAQRLETAKDMCLWPCLCDGVVCRVCECEGGVTKRLGGWEGGRGGEGGGFHKKKTKTRRHNRLPLDIASSSNYRHAGPLTHTHMHHTQTTQSL